VTLERYAYWYKNIRRAEYLVSEGNVGSNERYEVLLSTFTVAELAEMWPWAIDGRMVLKLSKTRTREAPAQRRMLTFADFA
jgi:hypothetical protein